ncbi:hypothetical protein R3P38DRAFT_2638194 [Favolaschia claudopus]|uniref:Uncharacterized protein n=1 Tax=Favolaschia claudopus TaxID=2862362 RepID=A0AAW0AQB2_9AGAR
MDHDNTLIEPDAPVTNYKDYLVGPKTNLLPAHGWTSDSILFNHLDENVNKVLGKPITSMTAIIITRDRPADRASGADAIADAILGVGLATNDDFTVIPPTPKEGDPNGPVLPHTNLILCDTPEIKDNILADPSKAIVNSKRPADNSGFSFYLLPAFPEASWYVGTYVGISERTTPHEFLSALFDRLIMDREVIRQLQEHHERVPNADTIPLIVRVILDFAEVKHCRVYMPGRRGPNSQQQNAVRLYMPPPSTDNKAIKTWKNHLTSASFTFLIDNRGRAAPFNPNTSDRFCAMECTECLGLDHYKDECPITASPAFRAVHPNPPEADHTKVGTTLGSIRDTDAEGFTTVTYRKGRGRFPRTYKRNGWANRPRRL